MRSHLSIEDLDSFKEGNVTNREKEKIKLHLSECKQCREKYNIMLDLENYLKEEDYTDIYFTKRVVDSLNKNKHVKKSNKSIIKKYGILKPVFSAVLICTFVGASFYFGTKFDSFKRNPVSDPDNLQTIQATQQPAAEAVPSPAQSEITDFKWVVILYFPNPSAECVVPEHRVVSKAQDEKLEEVIFRELQKGPHEYGKEPIIPEGTRLLSSEVKDGICYLNLSREFVDNNPGGTAYETVLINSIVNSLTELPYIEKVQFLIEGEVREVYTHLVFDEPFERNESFIRTPENTPEAIEEKIRELGVEVLSAFKNKDMQSLSEHIHPDKGYVSHPTHMWR